MPFVNVAFTFHSGDIIVLLLLLTFTRAGCIQLFTLVLSKKNGNKCIFSNVTLNRDIFYVFVRGEMALFSIVLQPAAIY